MYKTHQLLLSYLCYTTNMKGLMTICITVGGLLGGWIGQMMDHGNGLGGWSLVLGTVGSLVGIWAAIKLKDYI